MKKLSIVSMVIAVLFFFAACGGGNSSNKESQEKTDTSSDSGEETAATEEEIAQYDPHRGEGKYHDFDPGDIDPNLVSVGKGVYESKCQSCHKLSDEMLVGPGWAGVTKKHSADWILNFISNPDAMLDQDPQLLEQIEICMVRMPNQNLTDEDAEGVYDFMRENDK